MADLDRVAPPPARIREHVRRTLSGGECDWPALTQGEVASLLSHGIAPLVYSRASVRELRNQAVAAAAGEPLRLADLQAVLAALAAARIGVLIIKGTALAYDLYESPDQRPRGDTDLLVPRDRFDEARAVLRSIGFAEQVTSGDEHGVRQASFLRRDPHGAMHVYDLHWEVLNSSVFTEVIRQKNVAAVPVPAIGAGAMTLPRAQALMLACLHRVVHHYDDERLIWLVDIALLRRAMTAGEHERFWRMAAEHAVVVICVRSVAIAEEWTGESGPAAASFLSVEELTRREPSQRFLDPDVTYGGVMLANLRALAWRDRLTRIRQLAFPPAHFMRASFPQLGPAALPLLYVYRGLRGVLKLFRRERRHAAVPVDGPHEPCNDSRSRRGGRMDSCLINEKCVPCRGGVPPLAGAELEEVRRELGGDWEVVREHHLEKSFEFPDFVSALAFTNRIGEVAEEEGHHPDIHLAWGRVRVEIWTHKIDGLTRSDFILGAKIDGLPR